MARLGVTTEHRPNVVKPTAVEPRKVTRARRCVYCGRQVRGQVLACSSHRDLIRLDPHYNA